MHAATSPEGARPVRPLALATAAVAALVAAPVHAPHWLDGVSLLVTGRPLAPVHAVVLALALLLVARGVLLRRRAAWYGLVTLAALGVLAVLTGDDAAWRLPPLAAALVALWSCRGRFPVRPHPERVRAAVRTGAVLAVAAVLGSVLLAGVSPRSAGRDVVSGLGATGAPIGGASWLPEALGLAGAAGLLVL
ncbi:hypothetical protein, partial [Actinomadura roseirufa]|uniref:hypothetical protein n=1 Tax=Actinomadura roseirufa TaxID=2094049 RepID=UPI001A955DA5